MTSIAVTASICASASEAALLVASFTFISLNSGMIQRCAKSANDDQEIYSVHPTTSIRFRLSPHSANIDCAKVEQQCGGILTLERFQVNWMAAGSAAPSAEWALFAALTGPRRVSANKAGERRNVFEPLPCHEVDLRTGHGVTPGEARGIGDRKQPRRVATLGEEGHRVWGGRRFARRRSIAR